MQPFKLFWSPYRSNRLNSQIWTKAEFNYLNYLNYFGAQ